MSNTIIHDPERRRAAARSTSGRRLLNKLFAGFSLAIALLSVLVLMVLLAAIVKSGAKHLDLSFLSSDPNTEPEKAGIRIALIGTVLVCGMCALFTLPLGVATAIFLDEYRPRNPFMRKLHSFVQLNISNLAGVPSVVYGILGLTAFVYMFGLFGKLDDPAFEIGVSHYYQFVNDEGLAVLVPIEGQQAERPELVDGMTAYLPSGKSVKLNLVPASGPWPDDKPTLRRTLSPKSKGGYLGKKSWYYLRLPLGRSVLAGALTLSLVVLPIQIIAAQEALRGVPSSLREGAYGLGATQWQAIRKVTLPSAVPGIMTGSIIAMSRAIGEAAPVMMISGAVLMSHAPGNLMADFTVMPLQIYEWTSRPNAEFHDVAATGIMVLLLVLLSFNAVAVVIRQKLRTPLS